VDIGHVLIEVPPKCSTGVHLVLSISGYPHTRLSQGSGIDVPIELEDVEPGDTMARGKYS